MKFIDEATIQVHAGKGGDGAASFRREKFVPRGGPNGEDGRGADQYGRSGEDIELKVPVGTIIRDAEGGDPIADLAEDGARALIAKGGRGGLGNLHFKSSINRSPRQFTRGEPGESREL